MRKLYIMTNIGEAQITRQTRERLAMLKKFIPVRDSFRDNLQRQQDMEMQFKIGQEKSMKPITSAIGDAAMKVASEVTKVGTKTDQISSRMKKMKKYVKPAAAVDPQIILPPPEEFSDAAVVLPQEKISSKSPSVIFVPELINLVQSEDFSDDKYFAEQNNHLFNERRNYMREGYENAITDKKTFTTKLYLARLGRDKLPSGDKGADRIYQLVKQGDKNPPSYTSTTLTPQEMKSIIEADLSAPLSKRILGKGFDVPCSKSVFDDVKRLEVLIGGKRAGNNSPELTNESTEIIQRLFRGHIIDTSTYRHFINEIIDEYHSD